MTSSKVRSGEKGKAHKAAAGKEGVKRIKVKASPGEKTGEATGGGRRHQGTGSRSRGLSGFTSRIVDQATSVIEEGMGYSGESSRGRYASEVAGIPSRIVEDAASILEEEIAAGIVTAKRIEERFVDVPDARTADSTRVIQRFRRDAHDVIDILTDLVNVVADPVGGLTRDILNTGGGESGTWPGPGAGSGQGIPLLSVSHTARPGGKVEIPLSLENESDELTDRFRLFSTDLIDSAGNRIGSGQFSFSPASLVLEPRESARMNVIIEVPEDTPPGTYSGLLQATKLERLRAVIVLTVV